MAHKKSDPQSVPDRIAQGELEHPEKYPKTTIYGRQKFLEIVERECPHVLRNLVRSVRPSYERIRAILKTNNSGHDRLLGMTLREVEHESPELGGRLRQWARRYNLETDWVLETALRTLGLWTGERIKNYHWQWSETKIARPHDIEERKFTFLDDGWDATTETRADYSKRLSEKFSNRLKGYLDNLTAIAMSRGWRKTRELRSRIAPTENPYRHFYYLAYWQVNGWTHSEILKYPPNWPEPLPYSISGVRPTKKRAQKERGAATSGEAQRVRKGIEEAARIIGLPLRRGKPGHPRGARKSQPKKG